MPFIIYKGRLFNIYNLLTSIDSLARRYFLEQFKHLIHRNKSVVEQWSLDTLEIIWNIDPDIFIELSMLYNQKHLLEFREKFYDQLKSHTWDPAIKLPIALDVVRYPDNYYKKLWESLEKEYAPEKIHPLITLKTITYTNSFGRNALILCLKNCTDPKWVPIAKKLITSETKIQADTYGYNPLMCCLVHCRDPAWIPVAEQLIVPETIRQVTEWGCNALITCLICCKDPKWIPVAKKLITPETVKTVGASELITELKKHTDSQWLSLIDLIKEVS